MKLSFLEIYQISIEWVGDWWQAKVPEQTRKRTLAQTNLITNLKTKTSLKNSSEVKPNLKTSFDFVSWLHVFYLHLPILTISISFLSSQQDENLYKRGFSTLAPFGGKSFGLIFMVKGVVQIIQVFNSFEWSQANKSKTFTHSNKTILPITLPEYQRPKKVPLQIC